MILGLFGGVTAGQVDRRLSKYESYITKERDTIGSLITQAKADRMAALAEIRQELEHFSALSERLK